MRRMWSTPFIRMNDEEETPVRHMNEDILGTTEERFAHIVRMRKAVRPGAPPRKRIHTSLYGRSSLILHLREPKMI